MHDKVLDDYFESFFIVLDSYFVQAYVRWSK